MTKKYWKIAVFILLVLAIVIGNHLYGWSSRLGVNEFIHFLESQVDSKPLITMGIYTILTVIGCVVLALPGITFAIVAGLIFGPVKGTICCSVATTLGAMLSFLAGRYFLRDSIRPVAMKNPYLKKWLFDESGSNELIVLMITRLIPLFPYNLQNFAYGITDIAFSTYSVGSLLFMLPGTAMYTIGAAGVGNAQNRWLYIGIAAVLAVVVLGISRYLKRTYIQKTD